MTRLTVGELFSERRDFLELFPLLDEVGFAKELYNDQIHRPGLALAGHVERFAYQRTQVCGQTEMSYLYNLSEKKLEKSLTTFFGFDIPLIVVTKGMVPPPRFLAFAREKEVSVFQSNLSTLEFINRLSAYLNNIFSPQTSIHGTLVDVYGVGLLYTGVSGIGKSECALDLAERGHRLVADDVVKIIKKSA